MSTNGHSSVTRNSPRVETTQMSPNVRMDIQTVENPHSAVSFTHKKQ